MAVVLTETSTFDANVVVPQAGDARTAASVASPIQKLTNRTKYLNDQGTNLSGRIDTDDAQIASLNSLTSGHDALLHALRVYGFYKFDGNTYNTGDKFGLAHVFDVSPDGSFGYDSGMITVPIAGTYEIEVVVAISIATADTGGVQLWLDNSLVFAFTGDRDNGFASFVLKTVQTITTPSSQRINVRSLTDGMTPIAPASVTIKRVF